jgi:hypothetical protein
MKNEVRISVVPNKSKTYLLPILDEQVGFQFKENLLNSYCSFKDNDELFCVLYKWSSSPQFLKFEGLIMEHHLFEGHQDYGDKVLFKFRLPKSISDSRIRMFTGELKKIDPNHKKLIVSELRKKGVANLNKIIQILDINSEVTSTLPEKKKEIFMNHLKIKSYKADDFIYDGH